MFNRDAYHDAETRLLHYPLTPYSLWGYPPSFILYVLWLGVLPYKMALAAWLFITFALYAFAVAFKRPLGWGIVLLLILAPSSLANIDFGQNGFLSAALMVGGLRLMNVRPKMAGKSRCL